MKKIVLAGGCFWGVDAYFSQLKGVENTIVGYANGKIENPTYEEVKTGTTDFVEAVEITYNEDITLMKILEHLFRFIDPTLINQQGNDVGSQYRTGIYYIETGDKKIALEFIANEQKKYAKPIMVEVLPLINFYEAEAYHQKYLDKNPSGYCHVNLNLIKSSEKK